MAHSCVFSVSVVDLQFIEAGEVMQSCVRYDNDLVGGQVQGWQLTQVGEWMFLLEAELIIPKTTERATCEEQN